MASFHGTGGLTISTARDPHRLRGCPGEPGPRLRVVLVGTTHPGNIGAAARAMKTMCVERLHLVQPRFFPHAEATARASGADDVLARATVFDSLSKALAGCVLVVGASARSRSIAWPSLDPRQCARMVVEQAAGGDVALVFGREKSGLSNGELDLCHYLVHIPCNPDYGSLNLAAAVQVLCHEVMQAILAGQPVPAVAAEEGVATSEEMERFYAHLEQTLVALEFLDPDNPRQTMRRLRRLFNRARPLQTEVAILRGILSAAGQARAARDQTP